MKTMMKSLGFAAALALTTAVTADAANPKERPDGTWVTLSGLVVDKGPGTFTLDYGKGLITVEMDDWDWYDESDVIFMNDRVTVSGRIDSDFYEQTSLEASSVWVKDINTYFYANDADEEEILNIVALNQPGITYTGTVTSVGDHEFTMKTGDQEIRVDTSELGFNPLDDKGYLKIEEGEFVSASGLMVDPWFDSRELVANSVRELVRDKTKSTSVTN